MILNIANLNKTYVGKQILKGVTFHIEDKEKAAIVGINGSGKTTLIKCILGEEEPDDSETVIALSKGKKIGYLAQQHADMPGAEDDIPTDLTDAKALAMKQEIESYGDDFDTLSGGQKTRKRLEEILLTKPDLLILDEPTNHLDIESIQWLEKVLKRYDGAVLLVSHDRYFIDRFATRIWTLENGVITDFKGDYAAYQAWRERQKQLPPPPKPQKEEKVKKERPKRTGGTKQLKKDLAAAEKRMEKLDQLMETLNAEKEAAASDYQKLQELAEQEAEYTAEYDALMEKWEVLSEAIAAEEG